MRLSILGTAAYLLLQAWQAQAAEDKPNILFIFTDDQDALLNSIDYMPNVQKYLVQQGTVFRNHYVTTAVCCPSRVSLLRSQYAHNTNITHVSAPHGGYDRYNQLGLGEETLPVWMQRAGYYTHYIGKLMNGYTVNNYNAPKPQGFDYQDQLVDPFTYVYTKTVFSTNGEKPVHYKNTYQTDVVHAKAVQALKRQQHSDKPFFLWVAPMSPHSNFAFDGTNGIVSTPPIPAARHAHLFKDVKIPRTPNFNPGFQTKTASFWKQLNRANASVVKEFDETYRDRLRALQAVDEMVGSLFKELDRQGKLDNTIVIYTSDNGYHIGQHRAYPGKCGSNEEDIKVPFIVRGPGIGKGKVSDALGGHHDIGPTLLALAKASDKIPSWVDGGVLPLTKHLARHPKPASKESFAVEFWMEAPFADIDGPTFTGKDTNTYKTIRIISRGHNYKYTVWCTGEHEFFDLANDPYELFNVYNSFKETNLVNRLNALLVVLKTCRSSSCRDPWAALHPGDISVQSLSDALDARFDGYYEQFRDVAFKECLTYYDEANELPSFGQHFQANATSKPSMMNDYVSPPLLQRSLQKKSQGQQDAGGSLSQEFSNEQVSAFLNLVPEPESPVGQQLLTPEELDRLAEPIPQELIDQGVDWINFGFYSKFGN
ncbi:Arylsulphatase [Hesseltinella vesiculosa]|uniref:Arylsulfatase n=1 Tax=Hesseltinella vesiculosa TaxID=101127 RepID=A0A1X2GC31_9FUNG|nr:Arylsulphatase [Hesseltinella vesiculosa]